LPWQKRYRTNEYTKCTPVRIFDKGKSAKKRQKAYIKVLGTNFQNYIQNYGKPEETRRLTTQAPSNTLKPPSLTGLRARTQRHNENFNSLIFYPKLMDISSKMILPMIFLAFLYLS
jgi:hypothetical protein